MPTGKIFYSMGNGGNSGVILTTTGVKEPIPGVMLTTTGVIVPNPGVNPSIARVIQKSYGENLIS